jgi:chaperonin GroES
MQNTKPIGNKVLLEPVLAATHSDGGILLLEKYQGQQTRFKVLAVGPGKLNKKGVLIPPDVEPGDFVVAELYADHSLLPDGTAIVDAEMLLAKWNG